jgi:hypothetical protein
LHSKDLRNDPRDQTIGSKGLMQTIGRNTRTWTCVGTNATMDGLEVKRHGESIETGSNKIKQCVEKISTTCGEWTCKLHFIGIKIGQDLN